MADVIPSQPGREFRRRIGRRGAFLCCIGAYDLFYGWYLVIGAAIEHVPLIGERPWGWLWIAAGVFLVAGAFFRHDALFYAAAILIKVVWALEFFRLDVQAHVPDDWFRGCYWLALSAAILVVSGWREPVRVITPPVPEPEPVTAEQRARDA